jgi:hypothetical protein
MYEHWNGVDFTINARPRNGLLVQGGTSTERKTTDSCDLVAKLPEIGIAGSTVLNAGNGNTTVGISSSLPASVPLEYCHAQGTFLTPGQTARRRTRCRASTSRSARRCRTCPVPKSRPTNVATNAVVCAIAWTQPRGERRQRDGQPASSAVDVRRSDESARRAVQQDSAVRRTRATAGVDVYNALNASSVMSLNNAFANWQQPQSILPAGGS